MWPPKTISLKAKHSAETREAILASCLKLFARRGFASTSIDDIAGAAGITKGAIYWHFDSKEKLFHAILETIRVRWKLIVLYPVSLESSSFHKLEKLFDCYQELFVQDPEICLFIQRTLLEDDKLFSPEIGQMLTQTIRFVARILDGGKKTGDFSKELNSNLIAHEIIGILAGASQQLLINHSLSMNELLREAKQMVLARVTQQSKIG